MNLNLIKRNILVPMVGDLFHSGHVNLLERAKKYQNDIYINTIYVGLRTDEVCMKYKRRPIIDYENRKKVLLSCQYVDDIIKLSNTFIEKEIMIKYNIDLVIHAHPEEEDDKYNNLHFGNNIDFYNKLIRFDYTAGISTTSLLNRIKYLDYYNSYKNKGYFVIDDVYSDSDLNMIDNKIKNILNDNNDKKYYYYEKINNEPQLKKIEGFIKNSPDLRKLIEKDYIMDILKTCIEDEGLHLFKDKFNPKNANGSGFHIHIDGLFKFYNYSKKKDFFGWYSYANKFINLAIALDDCTLENGCLRIHPLIKDLSKEELYEKYNNKDNTIKLSKEAEIYFKDKCKPIVCKKGSIIIFDSLCVHYSEKNMTNKDRKIIYLTYNKKSEGDNYNDWITDKLYCKKITKDINNREI